MVVVIKFVFIIVDIVIVVFPVVIDLIITINIVIISSPLHLIIGHLN